MSYAALTDADITDALEDILEAALAASITKVFNRQVLFIEDGHDVEPFKDDGVGPSPGPERDPMVNAIAFWRETVLPPPAAFSPLTGRNPVPHRVDKIASVGSLRREVWTYRFKFYFQFDNGTSSADNSTRTFNALLDGVKAALDAKPKLGLNSGRIDRHSGLTWPEIKLQPVPDSAVHVATGLLSVLVHAAGNPS